MLAAAVLVSAAAGTTIKCNTLADCASMPACQQQPAGFEMYQTRKICLVERQMARGSSGAGGKRQLRGGGGPGVCICALPKFNCPVPGLQATAAVVELEMYMLHPPAAEFNLSSHDTGDLLGDTWFACADPSANKFGDSLFTKTVVAVNASFGGFARCTDLSPPPIPCDTSALGGDGHSVGRGLPAYDNPVDRTKVGAGYTGQCANNSAVGSWYSMPKLGRCKDGGLVGHDPPGCTWSVVKRDKTIAWSCLDKLGFTSKGCKAGAVVTDPVSGAKAYPVAATIMDQGFGLCPDMARGATAEAEATGNRKSVVQHG